MRIVYAKFIGYIGLYNGMKINELELDFTKCKNKIIVIKGRNGAGKSTLNNALHIYPDSNDNFIPSIEARKILKIEDNGILYDINIIHPLNNKNERGTTKAYILRNGEELNPNGNISSYKDVINCEFSLDPNFLALTQLSGKDRGLIDKKPMERKKFVNSIINNLEVYNNIYKTLSKKSSIFKSMINSINSKLASIGNEEELQNLLVSLENRIENSIKIKDEYISQIASYKSKIEILDPDCSIQNMYKKIYDDLVSINSVLRENDNKLEILKNKLKIEEDDINNKYLELTQLINQFEIIIKVNESKINSILENREKEAKSLQEKSNKLQTLQLDYSRNELVKNIKDCKEVLDQYKNILSNIGILDQIFNISKEEFIIGLNSLKDIKNCIDVFKSYSDYSIIKKSIEFLNDNKYPNIELIEKDIDKLNNDISEYKIMLEKNLLLSDIANKLKLRPKNCKIDTCNFIKDSVKAMEENPFEKAKIASRGIQDSEILLKQKYVEKDEAIIITNSINNLKSIMRYINSSVYIFKKLPIEINIFNKENLFKAILSGYDFNEIDNVYKFIEYSNIIDEYKNEYERYKNLSDKLQIYNSRNELVKEITTEIDCINKNIENMNNEIQNMNNEIIDSKNKISNLKSLQLDFDQYMILINNCKELTANKDNLISNYNSIKNNMVIIKDCMTKIDLVQSSLDKINNEINPLLKQRDTVAHSIKLSKEYNEELEIYNTKYTKTEIIKKHSSPGKGIQVLFMQVYMNKTLSLANKLLSLLFDNEYMLGNFIIDEDEFRIPCIGSGITNNDVSSMSTSQICMISMIVSFVLLYQSSTRYNIIKLDEIDGGLDTKNRLIFLTILDNVMDMLSVEQCFLISHNNELDMSNCDIIQLKMNEGEEIKTGNIIYKY